MIEAEVVVARGRQCVAANQTQQWLCAIGRSQAYPVVGDKVMLQVINHSQAAVMAIVPRRNLFYRQDLWRTKAIAANLDQIMVMVAVKPTPLWELTDRALIAAAAENIEAVIGVNKIDLGLNDVDAEVLSQYRRHEYQVHQFSALQSTPELKAAFTGKTTLVMGASGVGKSTLIRHVTGFNQEPDLLSASLSKKGSGQHTTTFAKSYRLDNTTTLVDSPGLQTFGLQDVLPEHLFSLFYESRQQQQPCQYANCAHLQEPGCQWKQHLCQRRYASYVRLMAELKQHRNY